MLCLDLIIYVVDHTALNAERLKAQKMNQFYLMMQDGKLLHMCTSEFMAQLFGVKNNSTIKIKMQ